MMHNYIFKGTIRHRRFFPFLQNFKYNTFMSFFDISEIENLFTKSIFWNVNKPAIVSYYRSDYHGDPSISLDQAIRRTVLEKQNINLDGPIKILTHLRYFGYCFNPVSFYYCYEKDGKNLKMIVAEVTNTPWNERHCYFITSKKNKSFRQNLKKEFHVSPFWDMGHDYDWYFSDVSESLSVNMINYKHKNKVFDATLTLNTRKKLTKLNLFKTAIRFPLITFIVFLRIHFQAFKLWIKGATFYNHPRYNEDK